VMVMMPRVTIVDADKISDEAAAAVAEVSQTVTHRGQRPRSAFERFIPARAGGTLYRTYFAKKMLTYLEASRQQRYIHERWPVSKRVNSSRASGDDSTLIERSRDDR
jgi:hypothetical protein